MELADELTWQWVWLRIYLISNDLDILEKYWSVHL